VVVGRLDEQRPVDVEQAEHVRPYSPAP
jgi:hypothetical protein